MRIGIVMIFGIALCARAQQAAPALRGQISVTVKGEDGSILSGAGVFLERTGASSSAPKQRGDRRAVSSAAGAAVFDVLANGQYTLCVQAVSGHWLNPCEWGLARPSVIVSAAQRAVDTTVVLKRAAAVLIRVDDPAGLLAQHEGKTPGAHLLLGVRSDALIFHPASVIAQDSAGRTYEVTVPFDAKLNVVAASSFFRLTDGNGAPFATNGSGTLPVTVPTGKTPPTLRLGVSGRR